MGSKEFITNEIKLHVEFISPFLTPTHEIKCSFSKLLMPLTLSFSPIFKWQRDLAMQVRDKTKGTALVLNLKCAGESQSSEEL